MVLCGVEYNRPYKFNPWGAKELPAASRSPPTTVMGQIMATFALSKDNDKDKDKHKDQDHQIHDNKQYIKDY